MKDILLVSYKFPPWTGIGTRRWSKLSRALAGEGYRIHVLASRPPSAERIKAVSYNSEVEIPAITRHFIPSGYPEVLITGPTGLLEKVEYFLLLRWLKLRVKGNPYDASCMWQNELQKAALALINEHRIRNVIVTGAPFHSMYFTTLLKNKIPDLNIISDLRDPWTDSRVYGFPSLNEAQLKVEKSMERKTVMNSDWFTTPSEAMSSVFRSRYPEAASRIITLTHFFEKGRDREPASKAFKPKDKIHLFFGGSIDLIGIDRLFIPLVNALKKIRSEDPALYSRFKIDFFSVSPRLKEVVQSSNVNDVITFHDPVPPAQYAELMASAGFLTAFLPDHLNDFLITKIIEYLPYRKPVLLFSEPRAAATFLTENKIGFNIHPDNTYNDLMKLVDLVDTGKLQFNMDFDIEQYSINSVVQSLVKLLK